MEELTVDEFGNFLYPFTEEDRSRARTEALEVAGDEQHFLFPVVYSSFLKGVFHAQTNTLSQNKRPV